VRVGCWLPLRWTVEPRLFMPHMAIPTLLHPALHELSVHFTREDFKPIVYLETVIHLKGIKWMHTMAIMILHTSTHFSLLMTCWANT
jgi:hypothetical protein